MSRLLAAKGVGACLKHVLVGVVEHRHVPFEQVDEHRLARGEHHAKHALRRRRAAGLDDMKHERTPLV